MSKLLPLLLLLLIACGRRDAYLHFESTDATSWERTEELHFTVDSLPRSAPYRLDLLVRRTAEHPYPFRTITLEVRQRWTLPLPPAPAPRRPGERRYLVPRPAKPSTSAKSPRHPTRERILMERTDTVVCTLTRPDGRITAPGIARSTHTAPLLRTNLPRGARGQLTLRHLMLKEQIPGIADIGLRVAEEPKARP